MLYGASKRVVLMVFTIRIQTFIPEVIYVTELTELENF